MADPRIEDRDKLDKASVAFPKQSTPGLLNYNVPGADIGWHRERPLDKS